VQKSAGKSAEGSSEMGKELGKMKTEGEEGRFAVWLAGENIRHYSTIGTVCQDITVKSLYAWR
jgi:hypothetical protein